MATSMRNFHDINYKEQEEEEEKIMKASSRSL